jgi:hypothetical protein
LEDLTTKRGLYELLGVREYFLFDPLDEYLSPRLQGFSLVEGYYQPMSLSPEGTLASQELGVILQPEDELLRIADAATGEIIPTLNEAMDQSQTLRQLAEEKAKYAEAEAKRADTAEAELARLQAELERLRRQQGGE